MFPRVLVAPWAVLAFCAGALAAEDGDLAKARLLRDQGKLPEAIACYAKIVADGKRASMPVGSAAVSAMLDLGISTPAGKT